MKIYTRTGDKGSTGLFGGTRISKASARLHAYGSLDELNACLGSVLATKELPKSLEEQLLQVQSLLFQVSTDLATPLDSSANILRMDTAPAEQLEKWIDAWELSLPPLTSFILPGGSVSGAKMHEARTICRRAERHIVELQEKEPVTDAIIVIVNRLSDYLFVVARIANKESGIVETIVNIPRKPTPPPSAARS